MLASFLLQRSDKPGQVLLGRLDQHQLPYLLAGHLGQQVTNSFTLLLGT